MTLQEAYDIAIKLSSFQLKGFLYLDLSLKQVMSKQYKDCQNTAIGEILDKSGINFFIPKEEQGNARKAFDKIIEKHNRLEKTQKEVEPLREMIIKPLNFQYSTAKQKRPNSKDKVSGRGIKKDKSGSYKPYKLK